MASFNTNGTAVPPNGPSANRTRDWVRSGEPGSAFRGLASRGRGGGRGSGRGGGGPNTGSRGARANSLRGGRGEGNNTFPADNSTTKPQPPLVVNSPKSTTGKPSAQITPRSKPSSRQSSRSIPSLVLDSSSSTVVSSAPMTPSRYSNRRRRPQQQHKPPATAVPKSGGLLDPDQISSKFRPQRSRSGPASPSGPSKDAPPHLQTASDGDMRHHIDALVERMRTVAMADSRPTPPGSHIDWAGDDDDSLPDLDDWGVKTGSSTGNKDEEMSPIIVDGLKPLPDPAAKAGSPLRSGPSVLSPSTGTSSPTKSGTSSGHRSERKRTETPPSSSREPPPKDAPCAHPPCSSQTNADASDAKATPVTDGNSSPMSRSIMHSASVDQSSGHVPSVPHISLTEMAEVKISRLHPSLPVKPVAAVENLEAQLQARDSTRVAPIHFSTPSKVPSAVEPPALVLDEKSEIGTSSNAPKDLSSCEGPADIPKCSDSFSPPSRVSSHTTPSAPRAYNPMHGRNHTVGRTPSYLQTRPLHMVSSYPFNSRFSRSGTSTPAETLAPSHSHARTHSTPPPGSSLHREPNARRPVITGDAISKLARTIGRSNISQTTSTSVSKD